MPQRTRTAVRAAPDAAVWHDVECAAYEADIATWRELAGAARGPILELGCGTGRVALRLAADGFDVTGLDSDPELVAALRARAAEHELRADGVVGDARAFELDRSFALMIAPMQVVQLLGGRRGRVRMLDHARAHLRPGAAIAIALANPFEATDPDDAAPPLPDMLERDGWVYSSTPLAMRTSGNTTVIERLRSAVSPSGELTESLAEIALDLCAPDELEAEARAAGLVPRARRVVEATPDYIGSTVVVLESP